MAISAPAALKGASDNIKLTEPVCWNCGWGPGYGYYRPYYRPWFRPYYRPAYYGYGGPYYRPYYRLYWVGTIGRTGPGAAREMCKHLARAG